MSGEREYRVRIEQMYQRALLACAARSQLPETMRAVRERLEVIDRQLGDLVGVERPIAGLATRLQLDPPSVDFLWAAVACAVDGRIVPHLEALGGPHARRGLSLAVYAAIAGDLVPETIGLAERMVLSHPLVVHGLLASIDDASPAARAYLPAPRLVAYLSMRTGAVHPLRVADHRLDLLHDARQRAQVQTVAAALSRRRDAVVVLEGPRGSGRTTAVAAASGGDVVVLDLAALQPLAEGLVALRREAALGSRLLVLANVDHVMTDERPEVRGAIGAFIDGLEVPLAVTVSMPGTDLGTRRPVVRIPWRVAEVDIRTELWQRAAGEVGGDLPALAHRYRVGPAAIHRAVASTRLLLPEGAVLEATALATGLRHNIAEQLGGLAGRVEVTQSWDDLIVADDTVDQIAALVGRIRHAHHVLDRWGYRAKIARGTGVAALFSGPPGTGKTMVAGLIARDLDLELYQVDLSKVVSKWVGETEKQLARIFDAAEEGHALLLFDEADALFGQRSAEMKSAVDRYANLEVNYLLQRVEAFEGITILTTNLETAIDAALKRRLAAHIVFATPDEDERARLWDLQIRTRSAPLAGDLNVATLAERFPNMSGANIRNAALAAAFLAAGEGANLITQEHLIRAARVEYRSMGHMVTEAALTSRRDRSTL